jgi:sigma-E factor negative regulatory protein RseA
MAPLAMPVAGLSVPAGRSSRTSAAAQILAAGRTRWLRPMAAAAGFVAVAGVVVVLRQADPAAAGPAGAQWAAGGAVAIPVSTQGLARAPEVPAAATQGQMLRDAQLDAYLRAHRDALAGSPPALPGGGVRTVEFDVPPR